MPIFTTAVSGSGTNRSQGLEHGGIASHFTGSIHIFSGSFPGQMGLNITGSALATAGVHTNGIYAWNFYGANAQVMEFDPIGGTQVDFLGDIKVGGNIIRASDGGSTITMDTSDNVTIGGNIQVGGNVIKASDGGSTITMDTDDNVTIAGDATVGGGNLIFSKDQNAAIDIEDVSGTDIAGMNLSVLAGAGTGLGAGGQIDFKVAPAAGVSGASVNAHQTLLTLDATGVSTFAGSIQIPSGESIRNGDDENVITIDADQNVTIGNNIKITGNIIQASDGGSTITMDASDNVTVGGSITAGSGNFIAAAGNNLTIQSPANAEIYIDTDEDSTSTFKVYTGPTDGSATNMLTVDESGNMDIAGNIQVAGLNILNASSENTITLDDDQRVGIGGITPTYKLDVDGDIRVRGNDIRDGGGNPAITFDGSANTGVNGVLTVTGNQIKDSGGNTQITFSAGSKATFGYDIETAGTGSVAMLQVGTSLGNPIGDNNKGYPLRVSNDSTQNGSKAGIIVDTRDTDTIGAYAFEKQGNIGSGNGSRRGWYFDWSSNGVDGLAWRNSESDDNKHAPFVINSNTLNNRGIRVGGGAPIDNLDYVQGILITGSDRTAPSQLKLRSHHNNAYGHAGGVPLLSWQYEINNSTANAGYWQMGVSPLGRQYNEATANALTICSPSPGTSAINRNYQAITIQKGGVSTAVGIGGVDGTTDHTYGGNRALIPTGTLHVENQNTDVFDGAWQLSKAQLFLGNSGNSAGEIPAVIAFDVARESNPEKYTAHIGVVNNDDIDGHEGFMHFGLYDGTGNTFSTRPRLRIDSQGAALFLSGTAPGSAAGWPRANDSYWDISELDIPSGSITCVSLMDGSSGKDPATINLVSWTSVSVNGGSINAGDNLGRIAWWSADPSIDGTGEQWQQVAGYIETVAPASHGTTTYASGEMDFYVRGESETNPNLAMRLTGEAVPSAKFPGKISSNDPTNVPLTIDGHRNYMLWQGSWATGDDQDEKVIYPYSVGDILKSGLTHPTQWRYCWTAPADGYIELVEATPMYNFGKSSLFINSTIRWYKVGNTAITDVDLLSDFGSDTGVMSYYTTGASSRAGKPTTFDFGSGTSFSAGDRLWMSFQAGANDFYDETGTLASATNYLTFQIIYVLKESELTT